MSSRHRFDAGGGTYQPSRRNWTHSRSPKAMRSWTIRNASAVLRRHRRRVPPAPASADPDLQKHRFPRSVPELKSLAHGTPRLFAVASSWGAPSSTLSAASTMRRRDPGATSTSTLIIGDDALLGASADAAEARRKASPRNPLRHFRSSIRKRPDGAPNFAGLPPVTTEAQQKEYAAIARERDMALEQPNLSRANEHLKAMGVRPLSR